MKKLAVLMLVLLLSVAATVPAYADRPTKGIDDITGDFPLLDCRPYQYSFQLRIYVTYQSSWTLHVDKDGNWRMEEHVKGVHQVYNESYPDRTISGPFDYNNHIEEYTGPLCPTTWPCMIRNSTGLLWSIQLPGRTLVYRASGLSTIVSEWTDEPYTGPEEVVAVLKRAGLNERDETALCSALAP